MSRLSAVAFADSAIDRAAHRRSQPGLIEALLVEPATRVVEMTGEGFAVTADGDLALRAPRANDGDADLLVFLGQERDQVEPGPAYLLVARDESQAADQAVGLRQLAGSLDADRAALAATAQALSNWHRAHPRCSRCGAPTRPALGGWTRRCPQDDSEHYPRTDMAVIMAVTDGDDRLLLGRAPSWPPGRMSILAGFVEPGETLAQAVRREVREEVGIEVRDIEYVADQPWPFPSSLMVGFTARAVQTDLVLDDAEIAEARWVSRRDVAGLIASGDYRPSPGFSISRALVEDWYGGALPTDPVAP